MKLCKVFVETFFCNCKLFGLNALIVTNMAHLCVCSIDGDILYNSYLAIANLP